MSTNEKISSDQMDEILNQLIGQGYTASVNDERGCGMGRDGNWLSPKSIVDGIRLALDEFGIQMEEPMPEPEYEDEEEEEQSD